MGVGSSSDFDTVHNESFPYVKAEEIPMIIKVVEEKLELLDKSKEELSKYIEIPKDIHFESRNFDIVLEGNGEKTKQLIQSKFPRCNIEVRKKVTGGYSGGTGRNTYESTYVKDCLRFTCD